MRISADSMQKMNMILAGRNLTDLLKVVTYSIIFIIAFKSSSAFARYDGPMRFSLFLPCSGSASFCGIRVLAEGRIERDSGKRLQEFINRKKSELPPVTVLVFDSPGGSVFGAMELGTVIRQNRLDTQQSGGYSHQVEFNVIDIVKNAKCASSCTLAFVGGINRVLDPDAKFGIHQFSGASGNIGDGATQVTVVALASYLQEMGISRELLDAASLVPSNQIYWLTPGEAKRLRVDNSTPYIQPWKIAATTDGRALLLTEQEISHGRKLGIKIYADNGNAILLFTVSFDRLKYGGDRIKNFPLNEPPSIKLSTPEKSIQTRPLLPWNKVESNGIVTFKSTSTISLSDLEILSKGKSLYVLDPQVGATKDISLTTDLSTEGFQSGVSLLLKSR